MFGSPSLFKPVFSKIFLLQWTLNKSTFLSRYLPYMPAIDQSKAPLVVRSILCSALKEVHGSACPCTCAQPPCWTGCPRFLPPAARNPRAPAFHIALSSCHHYIFFSNVLKLHGFFIVSPSSIFVPKSQSLDILGRHLFKPILNPPPLPSYAWDSSPLASARTGILRIVGHRGLLCLLYYTHAPPLHS